MLFSKDRSLKSSTPKMSYQTKEFVQQGIQSSPVCKHLDLEYSVCLCLPVLPGVCPGSAGGTVCGDTQPRPGGRQSIPH